MKAVKYHGTGNDFIIIHEQSNLDYSDLARKICHRHTGVGADGLIIVKEKPLTMKIFNADGSEAPMCGNGLRCFVMYCYDKMIVNTETSTVLTKAGPFTFTITSYDPFKVLLNLGKPYFEHELLSINSRIRPFINQKIMLNNQEYLLTTVFLGTIHTVILVSNIMLINDDIARQICEHQLYPEKTNVNFVEIIDHETLKIRTYERGVGWTLACGTGASSAFFIVRYLRLCDDFVKVILPFGILEITYLNDGTITLEGPAIKIANLTF